MESSMVDMFPGIFGTDDIESERSMDGLQPIRPYPTINVARVEHSILSWIGNSPIPMVELSSVPKGEGISCKTLLKFEYSHCPSSSLTDRIARIVFEEVANMLGPNNKSGGRPLVVSSSEPDLAISYSLVAAAHGMNHVAFIPAASLPSQRQALLGYGTKFSIIPDSTLYAPSKGWRELGGALAKDFATRIPGSVNLDILLKLFGAGDRVLEGLVHNLQDLRVIPNLIVLDTEPLGANFSRFSKLVEARLNGCKAIFADAKVSSTLSSTTPGHHHPSYRRVEVKDGIRLVRRLIADEGVLCGPTGGTGLQAAFNEVRMLGKEGDESFTILLIVTSGLDCWDRSFLNNDWMVQRDFYNQKDINQRYWWNNITLGNLRLKAPPKIWKGASLKAAVSLFEASNARSILVYGKRLQENNGNTTTTPTPLIPGGTGVCEVDIVGILTQDMVRRVVDGDLQPDTKIMDTSEVMVTRFGRISRNGTLGELEIQLQSVPAVVTVGITHQHFGNDEMAESFDRVTGIATWIDLIQWISSVENHHQI